MENSSIIGLKYNSLTLKKLLTDKTMLVAYLFLILAIFGLVEMVYHRYFLLSANAFDAGLNPANRDVAEAMGAAVFGDGGEVKREAPWSLYIVNYMYMIYAGSGIIFIVAIAELMEIDSIVESAAEFLTLGLGMLMAGLFTILMDLNVLNMHWMVLDPQFSSGMWLMMPLYMIYIPLVILEIYLILTHHDSWIKKVAFLIIVVGVIVEFVEFYIQAKLFDMNSARHLWTTYPALPLYFMVSSFAASVGIMIFYSYIVNKGIALLYILERSALFIVMALGAYEAVAYLFIDKKWAEIILFGDFKFYFYFYIILTIVIPFTLLFQHHFNKYFRVVAALSIILGTYLGKMIFVYGGNAYPMSNRFGVGFEKYGEYEPTKEMIFFMPHLSEIAIVIGSVGIVIFLFRLIDMIFSIKTVTQPEIGA